MSVEQDIGDIKKSVQIDLDRATIVVLGDVLTSLTDKLLENKEIDQPQAMALWHLENAIESVCSDSFRPDYPNILAEAKKSMGEFK